MSDTTELDSTVDEAYQQLLKDAQLALTKAKINMMRPGAAFISAVCFGLEHKFSDQVPTAGTDGISIYYNPKWFTDLKPEQRVGLVMHETWHVALLHCANQKYSRLGKRNRMLWNVSADAVINEIISKSGFELPPDGVWMPEYSNMSTEAIYKILLDMAEQDAPELPDEQLDILSPNQGESPEQNPDNEGNSDSSSSGSAGQAGASPASKEVNTGSAKEDEKTLQDIQTLLVRAATISKMSGEGIGNLPGELQLRIEKILSPKLPWQQLLQRYVSSRSKTNYSFTRPNRRYLPNYYLPSKTSLTVDHVVMAIDMSGSVTDADINLFINEIAGVMATMKPKRLDMLEFDTHIQNVTRIQTKQDIINHRFTGRGGTSIFPVFKHLNENPMNLMVIFTDGYFYQRGLETKKSKNLLWVIYDNPGFTSKYGHIIHVDT